MWIFDLRELDKSGEVIRRVEQSGKTAHDAAIAVVGAGELCLDLTNGSGDEVFVVQRGKIIARNTWREAASTPKETTMATTTYIIERHGWNQWQDDGGVWQGSREAAKQFGDRQKAEEVAANLNAEFGDDCDDCRVVRLHPEGCSCGDMGCEAFRATQL